MNDHNLDDLIIDTPEKKGGKAKGFLTIIALFIVVLIVAIILTKIILKDPDSQHAILEDNETTLISPELTLQDAVDEEEQDEKALSDMIKSEMDTPKEPSPKADVEEVAEETVVIEESEPEKKTEETTAADTPAPAAKPAQSKPSAPVTETKPEKKEIVKIPQKKPVTKPVTASKPKPAPAKAAQGQYYIQVGSFSKKPNSSRLTSSLRKLGFHYQTMKINGMYKIMVGPYPSRPAADRAIVRVKDLINKQAFVVKK